MFGMVGKPVGNGGTDFGMEGIVGIFGMAPALESSGSPPPDGRDGMVGEAPAALGSGDNPPQVGRDGMEGIGGTSVGCGSWRSCRAAIPFSTLQNETARKRATTKKLEEEAMFRVGM
ncbi:unnamed protein product [Linum trigynum]|uniref:Uncharacterized protein n=1 Tax=Linum trigynum TaxID=586398 RepID=A0AAV2GCE1_9ROSI